MVDSDSGAFGPSQPPKALGAPTLLVFDSSSFSLSHSSFSIVCRKIVRFCPVGIDWRWAFFS